MLLLLLLLLPTTLEKGTRCPKSWLIFPFAPPGGSARAQTPPGGGGSSLSRAASQVRGCVALLLTPVMAAVFTVRHGGGAGGQEGGRGEASQGRRAKPSNVAATAVGLNLTWFPPQEYGVPFMETSAKTGANVELAFLAIAKWVDDFVAVWHLRLLTLQI